MLRGLALLAVAASVSYVALAIEFPVTKLTAADFDEKTADGKVRRS